jgi:predicted NACHT family NTPase
VEQARGIYSFSHLTFQEYFTAKHLASLTNRAQLDLALQRLSQHMTEPRWREVILLTAGLLQPADPLLKEIERQIAALIPADDATVRQFLTWVEAKATAVAVPVHPAALRAFYFSLAIALDCGQARELSLATALDITLSQTLPRPLSLDLDLARALTINLNLTPERLFEGVMALSLAVDDPDLARSLQQFKDQLPDLDQGSHSLKTWWQTQGSGWGEQLRAIVIRHRNIGQAWNFNAQQRQVLQQYYSASKLLVDCLQSHCQISPEIRQQLESGLLQLSANRRCV